MKEITQLCRQRVKEKFAMAPRKMEDEHLEIYFPNNLHLHKTQETSNVMAKKSFYITSLIDWKRPNFKTEYKENRKIEGKKYLYDLLKNLQC